MESDRVDKLCRRRFDRTELEPASSPVCDFYVIFMRDSL